MMMRLKRISGWLYLLVQGLIFSALLALSACNTPGTRELNKRVTLWREDKIPYGTYVAYHSLADLFPDAELTVNRKSPLNLNWEQHKKAYVIIAPVVAPDGPEVTALLNFAGRGNHIFISALSFSDTLLRALKIKLGDDTSGFIYSRDSLRLSVYNPLSSDSLSFAYPGYGLDSWVQSIDTPYTSILGRDNKGRPDFIRLGYVGGGTINIHFAPMAFSNFFLLHKHNIAYLENVFSYLPTSVKEVMWDDYYRYSRERKDFSVFSYILNNRSLRWAFWLLLLVFGLIYLFETKRRQRMVPVISGLRNNSLDFVKTIGRLYYQRRDNRNLAEKMIAHFQDHVRTKYNMAVAMEDKAFADRLSFRTGLPVGLIRELLYEMQLLLDREVVADEELMALQARLEHFYQHT